MKASPYEEQLKRAFVKAYRNELTRLKRKKLVSNDDDLIRLTERFAKRYDAKHMTKFSEYVNKEYDYKNGSHVSAFEFTGRVL